MSKLNIVTLQDVETRISGMIGTVESYISSHRSLVSLSLENKISDLTEQPVKIGIVDFEFLDELKNMLVYSLSSSLGESKEILPLGLLLKSLFEESIYNQRLDYNPSDLNFDNKFDQDTIALEGGRVTTLLSILSHCPYYTKEVSKIIYDNIDKNPKEFSLNFLLLLGELANKILSKIDIVVGREVDKIFERESSFVSDILSKQVVDIQYNGRMLIITTLGDYRTNILNSFIRAACNVLDSDSKVDSARSLISNTINDIGGARIKLLDNYVMHFMKDKV